MIKEKDYPYFAYPEGRRKFERFIRVFNIIGTCRVPRKKKYFYFRDEEENSYLHDIAMGSTCDHPSIWYSQDKNGDRKRYIVFQSYTDLEHILDEMQNSTEFIHACVENGHSVDIYCNHLYDWHNKGMITVVVKLDDYWENQFGPDYYYVTVHDSDKLYTIRFNRKISYVVDKVA